MFHAMSRFAILLHGHADPGISPIRCAFPAQAEKPLVEGREAICVVCWFWAPYHKELWYLYSSPLLPAHRKDDHACDFPTRTTLR